MLKEWQKRMEPQKRLSLSEMAAESETTLDVEARKRALQVLPLYFKKIIGPYELRCYWFEVFECIRKVCLVGLPVWFRPGQPEQLVLGLIICFVSFGGYMFLSPFTKSEHDLMSQLCQFQIFFALLAGVVLKTDPTESETAWLGTILTVMCVVPPLFGFAFANKRVRSLFNAQRRQKFIALSSKYLRPIWDRLKFRERRTAQKSQAKAKAAWAKSFHATNAPALTKSRTIASLMNTPAGVSPQLSQGQSRTTKPALSMLGKSSKPSLLDQLKEVKASNAPSAASKVSFAAAAASIKPSTPDRRAKVAPIQDKLDTLPAPQPELAVRDYVSD